MFHSYEEYRSYIMGEIQNKNAHEYVYDYLVEKGLIILENETIDTEGYTHSHYRILNQNEFNQKFTINPS